MLRVEGQCITEGTNERTVSQSVSQSISFTHARASADAYLA